MSKSAREVASSQTAFGGSRDKPPREIRQETRPLGLLKPNPLNVRKHTKKQIGQIAKSMDTFGVLAPIIVDEDGVILAGHGRFLAAGHLGLKEVPVVQVSGLAAAEKRAFALADNKLTDNSSFDRAGLAGEFVALPSLLAELGLDVSITGFSTGEQDSILHDFAIDERDPADEVDPKPKPQVSRRGDFWQLGGRLHRVVCGDAQLAANLAKLSSPQTCHMVISDIPYNLKIQGHVGGRGKRKHQEFAFASGEMSAEEFRAFLKTTISHMVTATKLGGLVYIFIDWRHIEDVIGVGRALGLDLRNICVWSKTTPGQGSFYRSAHEMIVVMQVPGGELTNNIQLGKFGRNRTNVWSYPGINTFKAGPEDDLTVHPTVKPVAMIADAIKDASPRGGIILDPFLGSGTTLLACEKVGRTCHAMEIEPRYVDVAIRRWQKFAGEDAILVDQSEEAALGAEVLDLRGMTFDEVEQARRRPANGRLSSNSSAEVVR